MFAGNVWFVSHRDSRQYFLVHAGIPDTQVILQLKISYLLPQRVNRNLEGSGGGTAIDTTSKSGYSIFRV